MSVTAAFAFGTSAQACAFHAYLPEKTAIDRILETRHLITARSTGDNAFTYQISETLRGAGIDAEIDQLVDTTTRRKLAANPADSVLFAFDEATQSYVRLAYLTPGYRQIVDQVLSQADTWGPGYGPDRFRLFATLHDHPNAAVRNLALREIDQAPYALLRTMDVRIPTQDLLDGLWTRQSYAYQPITVLLLGLKGDARARAELYRFLDRVAAWDWANNLGAFATAAIEADGPAAIDRLERLFLSDKSQPLDKLEQVVEALAIHSSYGTPEVLPVIKATIARMIADRPATAPLVARQFGSRKNWSQAPALEAVVRNATLSRQEGFLSVALYVAQGRSSHKPSFSAAGN